MSSWYKIELTVNGVQPDLLGNIITAARSEWDFDGITPPGRHDDVLYLSGEDKLSGDPEDTVARIVHAIWEANGAYIEVEANSLYIEELPFEKHGFDEDDYDAWLTEKNGGS